jgi:hypothetical protein
MQSSSADVIPHAKTMNMVQTRGQMLVMEGGGEQDDSSRQVPILSVLARNLFVHANNRLHNHPFGIILLAIFVAK